MKPEAIIISNSVLTKAVYALSFIMLTFRYDLMLIKKSIFFDTRTVMGGLRTELAVLGASAASAVDDTAKIGCAAAEMFTQFICTFCKHV